jgi:hypothetical protein
MSFTFYRHSETTGTRLVPFNDIPLSHMFQDKNSGCVLLKLSQHIVIVNNGSICDTELFLKNYTEDSRFRLVKSARFTTEGACSCTPTA